jgi:hypothetical protein
MSLNRQTPHFLRPETNTQIDRHHVCFNILD